MANAITASSATPGAVFQEAQAWEKTDSTSILGAARRALGAGLLQLGTGGVDIGHVARRKRAGVLQQDARAARHAVELEPVHARTGVVDVLADPEAERGGVSGDDAGGASNKR